MTKILETYRASGPTHRALVMLLLLAALLLARADAETLVASDSLTVSLSAGPGTILADGGVYDTLFLRLEDEGGLPFPFPEDSETEVSLWTSDPELFTVSPTFMVPAGSVAVSIPVQTTFKAGTGTITASVKNEGAASVTLETVSSTGALPPFGLKLELAPPVMPEGSVQPGRFVVSLRGAKGAPVLAITDTVIVLTSSRPGFAAPAQTTYTIPSGANAVFGEYIVGDPGDATITAQANGFRTDSAMVSVTPRAVMEVTTGEGEDPPTTLVPSEPAQLAVYVVPDRFLTGGPSALLVAQALDVDGFPVLFSCDVVRVTTDVVDGIRVRNALITVPQGLTCGEDATYAYGTVDSSGNPSPTQITVTQPGMIGATVEARGHTRPVASLDLSFAYPTSSVGDSASNFIIARLLDASGAPAPTATESPLFLFSEAADVPGSASFLPGESHKSFPVVLPVMPGGDSGTVSISGVLPGMESVIAEMEVVDAALQIGVTLTPSTIAIGQSTVIDALVTLGDRPVGGAALIWRTTSGELLNPPAVTDESGRGTAEFIPLDADSQVVVSANFGGIATEAAPIRAQVITSLDNSRSLPSLTVIGISIPLSLLVALFVILLAAYMGYRFLPGTRVAVLAQRLYDMILARPGRSTGVPDSRGE